MFNKIELDQLNISVYWKNKDGEYLGRNPFAAKKMQEQRFEKNVPDYSILGKTDYDLFDKKIANVFRENDLVVMGTGSQLTKEETIILPNGTHCVQISSKSPLVDTQGNIIGIIGNTIDVSHIKDFEKLFMSNPIKKYKQTAVTITVRARELFTPREIELLLPLLHCKTAKEIAAILGISKRTVEAHLENMKTKLNVNSKSELIGKIIDILDSD